MERSVSFKNTETGEELVMPVTPAAYQIEHGRRQNTETFCQVGDFTYPGPAVLLDEEPEFLLPARDYPFNQPGAVLNPFVYLEKLERWSDAGVIVRFVVAGTPVNAAVRFGPIRFREDDGTNNVKCIVPLRGVRQLAAQEVELADSAVPLASRPVEKDPVRAGSYTVSNSDTLWGLCKRFYGDTSPATIAALAAYNGIKNVNLIYVGQVLQIPERGQLPAAAAAQNGKVAPKSQVQAAVTVALSFDGPSTYYGRVSVDYTAETGSAAQKILSLAAATAALRAKRGTRVIIKWLNSSHKIAYYSVDGKTQRGFGELSVTADKDHNIRIGWGQ